jgi:hypothetical protein
VGQRGVWVWVWVWVKNTRRASLTVVVIRYGTPLGGPLYLIDPLWDTPTAYEANTHVQIASLRCPVRPRLGLGLGLGRIPAVGGAAPRGPGPRVTHRYGAHTHVQIARSREVARDPANSVLRRRTAYHRPPPRGVPRETARDPARSRVTSCITPPVSRASAASPGTPAQRRAERTAAGR